MKKQLKQIIPNSLMDKYFKIRITKNKKKEKENWIKQGKPNPPPHIIKEETISQIALKNRISTLIETGTHKGEMVNAQLNFFNKIHSIELNEKLHNENLKRFRKNKNVILYQGDSAIVIMEILKVLDERAVFWLDGHFDFTSETSKSDLVTPIRRELEEIAKSPFSHVIIIDDARLFNGENDYPTIQEFRNLLHKLYPNFWFIIENDMIIIQKTNEI